MWVFSLCHLSRRLFKWLSAFKFTYTDQPIFPFHARVIPLINGCFWSNHVKKGNNWKTC